MISLTEPSAAETTGAAAACAASGVMEGAAFLSGMLFVVSKLCSVLCSDAERFKEPDEAKDPSRESLFPQESSEAVLLPRDSKDGRRPKRFREAPARMSGTTGIFCFNVCNW